MNELDSLSEISDASLVMNKATMSVLVQKLEALDNDAAFRHMIVNAFNTLVMNLDNEKLPISGGMMINLLAIALDNKLDVVAMIADATKMRDSFTAEIARRINNATS